MNGIKAKFCRVIPPASQHGRRPGVETAVLLVARSSKARWGVDWLTNEQPPVVFGTPPEIVSFSEFSTADMHTLRHHNNRDG